MKRTAGQTAIIVVLLIAAAAVSAALIFWRSEPATTVRPNDPAGVRGPDGVVSGSGTVTNPLPTGASTTAANGAQAKVPAPTGGPPPLPPPAEVKFPYSYLAGRTPSEVRPDGTQVFKDVPFYVKQPDGTMKTTLTTITVQPAAPLPVKDEDAVTK